VPDEPHILLALDLIVFQRKARSFQVKQNYFLFNLLSSST
jgi:hypothetical protein